MATNAAIALVVAAVMWWGGVGPFLLVHLPITMLGGAAGVWLFYVQHQFEHTTWSEDRDWSFPTAALYGSSHYDLPAVLRWFTANIGVHHVHHLCSRIPFYRLPLALRDHPELANVGRLTLSQSFLRAFASCCGTKRRAGSLRFANCEIGLVAHQQKVRRHAPRPSDRRQADRRGSARNPAEGGNQAASTARSPAAAAFSLGLKAA